MKSINGDIYYDFKDSDTQNKIKEGSYDTTCNFRVIDDGKSSILYQLLSSSYKDYDDIWVSVEKIKEQVSTTLT